MPEPVGSIALRESGGLLAAMQTGIFVFENKKLELLVAPPQHDKAQRFNDGRCDRQGRFWVGTLKDPEFTPTGLLFRVEGKTARVERSAIKIPNSLAWSPDGRTMYFADSPRHKIWAFDYDTVRGEARNERVFAAPHPGFPDGSCVDAQGGLWNAQYGGARVVRYTPDGKLERVIEVPVKAPTCCCFGGEELDTLYITSARYLMTPEQIAAAPHSGALFACIPGVKGLADSAFAG